MSEVAEDRGQRPRDGEGLAQGHPHLEPELRAPNPPPPTECPFQLSTPLTDEAAFPSLPCSVQTVLAMGEQRQGKRRCTWYR